MTVEPTSDPRLGPSPRLEPPPDAIGTVIAGRYEIGRALGHGAFGRTFLARDRGADRLVAMKLLDPRDPSSDWKARELFEREAAVLGTLRHHGIPEMYDLAHDTWRGAPASFLVMEYVEGTSLAGVIAEQRQLDPAEVVDLLLELLGILEYLHGRVPPILHRDVKPSNVIVRPDGRPALVDFGAVRRIALAPDEAGSTIAGTYGYMPYEQYMGQASPASDLYALGASFLHLVTGRPPRAFMTDEGRIQVPDVLPGDPRLGPIIARMLRPSPAERFASAREVRQALLAPPTAPAAIAPAAARHAMVRGGADLSWMGTAPRALDGQATALLDRVAYSAWDIMDTSAKPHDEPGVLDYLSLAFYTGITFGLVPMVYFGKARARRRRVRRFVRDGTLGVATVLGMEQESITFGERVARVRYEFEADGQVHRDSDQVLPVIAQRWEIGDRVHVLYLAEPLGGYDSIIVSTA